MITLKMLNQVISPAESVLAAMTPAEGALILCTFLGEALEVTVEHVISGKPGSTATCVGTMFLIFCMFLQFAFVPECLITLGTCNGRVIPDWMVAR